MICTGNEFLFTFPTERFPIPWSAVACIRLLDSNHQTGPYLYLYQLEADGKIQVAEPDELGDGFHEFAASFVGVMEQLREIAHVVTN